MRLIAASLVLAAFAAGCTSPILPPRPSDLAGPACWSEKKAPSTDAPAPPGVPRGDEGGPDAPIAKGRMYQDLRQHTNSPAGANDLDPCVTADGETLYFASNRHSRFYDLYSKPTGGPAMTVLTTLHPECHKRFPSLSPDGKRLAFASDWKGSWDVYVMDVATPSAEWCVVSSFPEDEYRPTWSPDGTRIAFCRRSTKFGGWEVWHVGADGNSPTPIADGYLPAWGPSESDPWIVFQRPRQRDDAWFGIWCARPDGNLLTEVLPAETFGAVTPCWSPDGLWIAFCTVSRRPAADGAATIEDADDLHVISADGKRKWQITSQAGIEAMPFWGQDWRIYFASSAAEGTGAHFNIWSLKPLLP